MRLRPLDRRRHFAEITAIIAVLAPLIVPHSYTFSSSARALPPDS